jgi:hypothetical protein
MSEKAMTQKARFGNDKDRVKRVPFGLGQAPGMPGAAERALRCSFGNTPVVEEVVWTIPLPLTEIEAQATFGDIVNVLTSQANVLGVASIDSTFLLNGVLQTDLYTTGIGVHIFTEPETFSSIGNGWGPAPSTPTAPPPSPDVFTLNDVANGALGAAFQGAQPAQTLSPADLEWGGPAWRAGWHFINAYQFQWKTSQRELVLNELAADISYFSAFADAEASGTSEVPIAEYVAAVNALYRAKGAPGIFLPTNFRRVGSVLGAAANVGIFHPTRDFDLAPVTWGGLKVQGYGVHGQMFRQIENPCFLERGIPIGMQFVAQDPVHQAAMLAAMTIDNSSFGFNIAPDKNVTCSTSTGPAVMLEQTLDVAPAVVVNVPQQVNVCRQVFKGGLLKIGIKLKGWEMPGIWKAWAQQNIPQMFSSGAAQ